MGALHPPLQVSCVMGVTGGIRPTARNLAHMAEQVPDVPHEWGVIGVSRDQWTLVAAALSLGGNVRVGLEDNFYLPDGEMARSNGDLIARARRMAEDSGPARGDGRRGAAAARPARAGGAGVTRRARRAAGPRPVAAAAGRLLLAAAGRLRRRRDQGRGHGDGRLRPLGAAVLRGRRRDGAPRRCSSSLNRNKRSIRVDLKSDAGREVLLRLVRDADVLLESFRPGVLDRLGVGYEALREVNPGLVYCAITGYGQDGPLRDRAGHDMNYLGRIGLLGLTGEADGPPVQAAGQIADLGGGALMAAFGILAALRERDRTGRGPARRRLDGRRRALVAGDGRRALLRGGRARRAAAGSSSPARWSATGPYRCSDGWVTLGALEPKFWQAWCRGVGREDLIERQFEPPGSEAHARGRGRLRRAARAPSGRRSAPSTTAAWSRCSSSTRRWTPSSCGRAGWWPSSPSPAPSEPVRLLGVPVKLSRTPGDPARAPGPALGARHRGGAAGGRLRHGRDRGAAGGGRGGRRRREVGGSFLA